MLPYLRYSFNLKNSSGEIYLNSKQSIEKALRIVQIIISVSTNFNMMRNFNFWFLQGGGHSKYSNQWLVTTFFLADEHSSKSFALQLNGKVAELRIDYNQQ